MSSLATPDVAASLVGLLTQRLADKLLYCVAGLESGTQTHRDHLQGFLYLAAPVTMSFLKKIPSLSAAHLEVKSARSTFKQASDYCKKEGKFFEYGNLPLDPQEKGQKSKDMWRSIVDLAIAGRADEIAIEYPQMYVSHFSAIQRIAAAHPQRPATLPDTCGVWITGISGSGKSHLVRNSGLEVYDKLLNKWWDGYRGEPVVLIDDLSPESGEHLQTFLKRWCDKYPFTAESKGSASVLRPRLVVITSQYTIESCFPGCAETIEALNRRCGGRKYTLSKENRCVLGPVLSASFRARCSDQVSLASDEPSISSQVGSRSSGHRPSRSRSPSIASSECDELRTPIGSPCHAAHLASPGPRAYFRELLSRPESDDNPWTLTREERQRLVSMRPSIAMEVALSQSFSDV